MFFFSFFLLLSPNHAITDDKVWFTLRTLWICLRHTPDNDVSYYGIRMEMEQEMTGRNCAVGAPTEYRNTRLPMNYKYECVQ